MAEFYCGEFYGSSEALESRIMERRYEGNKLAKELNSIMYYQVVNEVSTNVFGGLK